MPENIKLKITGMTCEHCVMRVTKAAESVEGVSDIRVDLASGSLEASVDSPDKVEKIKEAVADAGYGAE